MNLLYISRGMHRNKLNIINRKDDLCSFLSLNHISRVSSLASLEVKTKLRGLTGEGYVILMIRMSSYAMTDRVNA